MHSEQLALPSSVAYVFDEHPAHEPPCAPKYPALHRQAVNTLLPLGDSALSGHAEHSALPIAGAYVLPGQIVHGPPCGPEYPTLH